MACSGQLRHGKLRQFWSGLFGRVRASFGRFRQLGLGKASCGQAGFGELGQVVAVELRQVLVWRVRASLSRLWQVKFWQLGSVSVRFVELA